MNIHTCAEPAPDILASLIGLALISPPGNTEE
jgi:hypothetical protein